MLKRTTLSAMLFSISLCGGVAFALPVMGAERVEISQQVGKCTGSVLDNQGQPVIGASVAVKGGQTGAVTNLDGEFSIPDVPRGTVLKISFIGYKTVEVTYKGTPLTITLEEDSELIGEVVVTAMGIKRSEKSLSYATQQIGGKELTTVPTANMLDNLAGKVAGMSISSSAAGVGSSVKVLLRGNRSIYGNNQPLYVVDGTPINAKPLTNGANSDGGYGGSIDAGDGLSGIAPEDIESINVLKGASAAALYGSQAANGVIMITTKRGSQDKTTVNFTSSFQADMPYMTYEFQDKYAMGTAGVNKPSNMQWGAKSDKPINNDFIDDFFETGQLFQNTVAVSGGSKMLQNYFSYQNTTGKGIMPKNKLERHNISLRSTTSLLDGFIDVDGSVALTKQKMNHVPSAPSRYFNPIVGLYLFPEGTDVFNTFKEKYEVMNQSRNIMTQNWTHEEDINKNPYWLVNRYNYTYNMEKVIAKLNLTFNLTDYLNLKLRGSYDKTNGFSERRVNYGVSIISSNDDSGGGRFERYHDEFSNTYGDALLNFNKTFSNWSVLATLGTSVSNSKIVKDGTRITLNYPNFFHMNNFTGRPQNSNSFEKRVLYSVFGTASLGWKDMLYLDVTGRNDWSSTLPKNNRSFFYPSIGTSFIFSEMLSKTNSLPSWLTFGKARLSWTQVGNDMPWGKTIVYDSLNELGDITANTIAPFTDLKPEKSTSIEAGLQLKLFDNRLSFDFAFYSTSTKNQYFLVDNTSGTGYSKYYINAGEIRNTGFEASIGFTPVRTKDFEWNGSINFSTNKNKVVSLPEQYQKTGLILGGGDSSAFMFKLFEGEEWGNLYVDRMKRDDQGRVIVTETQKDGVVTQQLAQTNEKQYAGNINPKFMLSTRHQFVYKGVSLGFQLDGRFGGKAISLTQGFLNKYGRSLESAQARDAGGVHVPAVTDKGEVYNKPINAEVWYTSKEGEVALYNATNVRLRELSLGYSLPASLLAKTKYVKGVTLSLVARNLFYLYRDAPFDPEFVLSTTSNSMTNMDNFSIPVSRNIGFTLNVNF